MLCCLGLGKTKGDLLVCIFGVHFTYAYTYINIYDSYVHAYIYIYKIYIMVVPDAKADYRRHRSYYLFRSTCKYVNDVTNQTVSETVRLKLRLRLRDTCMMQFWKRLV